MLLLEVYGTAGLKGFKTILMRVLCIKYTYCILHSTKVYNMYTLYIMYTIRNVLFVHIVYYTKCIKYTYCILNSTKIYNLYSLYIRYIQK
jgi:hypothetical protein